MTICPYPARVYATPIRAPSTVRQHRLINSDPPTPETDHFDCKLEPLDPKQRDRKAKEIWSEVLGGFANAGGGVLIWGLDARKKTIDGREIDAVVGEVPVANPRALESRLRELQRQATDPPLGNVEIQSFPLPGDDSKGFVVCLIPEGLFKPYRSEQAGQQFYLRAADNTVVMPKAVLASLFYPRTRVRFRAVASLEFKWLPTKTNSRPAGQVLCRMSLQNDGTATAREMMIRVTWKLPGTKTNMKEVGGFCRSNLESEFIFQHGTSLHPGFGSPMFIGTWEVSNDVVSRTMERGRVWGDTPPHIRMAVFAEDQEPQTIEVPIDMVELVEKEEITVEMTKEE